MPALEHELRWLRAYALLTYPFACVPFLFLYFRAHGLDLAEYGTVVTVYYVAMFVADVPTSVLADRLGQRAMMIAGPLVLGSGFVAMWIAPSFGGFCVGEALMGLGHSILSGPPSTTLYERLRQHGQEHRYLQEEARVHARRLLGTGGSFLLGGVLAYAFRDGDRFAYEATLLPTAALCLVCAVCATRLRPLPPPRRRDLRKFARQVVDDLWLREVRWLLAYWLVLFALLRYPFHNYQVVLDGASAAEPWFAAPLFVGALYAVLNLAAAPLSRRVPQLVERFGRRTLFWTMPTMLCVSMAVMAACAVAADRWPESARACGWISVSMFFLQQVPFGMHWALVQEFVNHRIQPEARSTVWSVLSLGGRLAYSPVNQGLFALQHVHGLAAALSVASGSGFVLTAVVLWLRPRGLLRGGDARDGRTANGETERDRGVSDRGR